jgi:hypothetical protein
MIAAGAEIITSFAFFSPNLATAAQNFALIAFQAALAWFHH